VGDCASACQREREMAAGCTSTRPWRRPVSVRTTTWSVHNVFVVWCISMQL
jgi:hypothetical protein